MLSPFCDQAAGSVYAVTPSRVGSLGSSNQEDSLTVVLTALILMERIQEFDRLIGHRRLEEES